MQILDFVDYIKPTSSEARTRAFLCNLLTLRAHINLDMRLHPQDSKNIFHMKLRPYKQILDFVQISGHLNYLR